MGRIVLPSAPALLPDIEVEANLPSPGFRLGHSVNLDRGSDAGPGTIYSPSGAAMTKDGVFVVQVMRQFGRPDSLMVTRVRNPRMVYGSWGFGSVCSQRRFRTVGTRIGNPIDPDAVLLLDATGRIWDGRGFGRSGTCKSVGRLDLPGRLLAASDRQQGWVVAVAPDTAPALVTEVTNAGRERWRKPVIEILGSEPGGQGLILASSSRGVTIAATSSPFTWAEVDSTGRVRVRSSPLAGRGSRSIFPDGIPPGWIAYPVLEVPNGFVQTLESERGDDGRLVVYDLLGRPLRAMGRMGFAALIASLPEERLAFGFHYRGPTRANGAHLFVYFY